MAMAVVTHISAESFGNAQTAEGQKVDQGG
jgi:hypothetical protein